jgi:hypothetical protein
VHPALQALRYSFTMSDLRLAPTNRYFGFGGADDYVVLDGDRVIGRILLHPQGPEGQPWFWTINRSGTATVKERLVDQLK